MELIGILLMAGMAFLCMRSMGGMIGGCCVLRRTPGRRHGRERSVAAAELRQELHAVRNWTRSIRRRWQTFK